MSKLSDKIDWAVKKFNAIVNTKEDAENNIGLLYYVKKVYPKGKFPAWARESLSEKAKLYAKECGFKF